MKVVVEDLRRDVSLWRRGIGGRITSASVSVGEVTATCRLLSPDMEQVGTSDVGLTEGEREALAAVCQQIEERIAKHFMG